MNDDFKKSMVNFAFLVVGVIFGFVFGVAVVSSQIEVCEDCERPEEMSQRD